MAANYARTANGKIIEAITKAACLKKLGASELTSDADLKKLGWLPLVEDDCNCEEDETHDGAQIVFSDDAVNVVYKKRPMTDSELASRETSRKEAGVRLSVVDPIG